MPKDELLDLESHLTELFEGLSEGEATGENSLRDWVPCSKCVSV